MKVFVPDDLKLILGACKFDSLFSLSVLEKTSFDTINTFMREQLHEVLPADKLDAYYGIYKFMPSKFKLAPGHLQALDTVSLCCRKIISSNTKQLSLKSSATTTAIASSEKNVSIFETNSNLSKSGEFSKLTKDLESSIKDYIVGNFPTLKDSAELTCIVKEDGFGSYAAEAPCPFKDENGKACDLKRRITRNETRWNTSNYYTHIRSHFERRKKKPDQNPIAKLIERGMQKKNNRRKRVNYISDDSDVEVDDPTAKKTEETSSGDKSLLTDGEVQQELIPESNGSDSSKKNFGGMGEGL